MMEKQFQQFNFELKFEVLKFEDKSSYYNILVIDSHYRRKTFVSF